jgi:hypothetical protein
VSRTSRKTAVPLELPVLMCASCSAHLGAEDTARILLGKHTDCMVCGGIDFTPWRLSPHAR